MLVPEQLEEVAAADDHQLSRTVGPDRRRTWLVANQCHLSDVSALLERGDVGIPALDVHLALEHDEQLFTSIALLHHVLAVLVLEDVRDLQYAQELALVERPEEPHAGQKLALQLEAPRAIDVVLVCAADADQNAGD